MKQQVKWLLVTLSGISLTQVGAAETLQVLECRATGSSESGQRVVKFMIVPPKSNERLNLWMFTEDDRPDQLVKSDVAQGEIQIDYGSHTERHDLIFLKVGNAKGSSHVAFWLRSGVFQHPNFVVVDIWDPEIPVQLMESVEPQPYLTGNCER